MVKRNCNAAPVGMAEVTVTSGLPPKHEAIGLEGSEQSPRREGA